MRRLAVFLLLFSAIFFTSNQPLDARSDHHQAAKNPIVSNVDVLIDVGHGGIDSGTLYGGLYEKDINLQISRLIYDLLRQKGKVVLMNRMEDYALSGENRWFRSRSRHLKDLAQRSHLANEIRPKAVVSIHVNWSSKSSKRGAIVLHQKSDASKRLAVSLQNSLNQLYGTSGHVTHGKPFYILKHIQVPAVICEMGFISNAQDRAQMTEPQKQQELAQAIANGILNYLQQPRTERIIHDKIRW